MMKTIFQLAQQKIANMTFEELLCSKDFLNAFESKTIKVFRNIFFPKPSWDQVIDLLNEDILHDKTRGQWYLLNGWKTSEADRIPEVAEICNTLMKYFDIYKDNQDRYEDVAGIFASITNEPNSHGGIHKDKENILFLQAKGSSKWTIFKDSGQPQYSDILNESDIIFYPGGQDHLVETISPRYAISLSFGEIRVK